MRRHAQHRGCSLAAVVPLAVDPQQRSQVLRCCGWDWRLLRKERLQWAMVRQWRRRQLLMWLILWLRGKLLRNSVTADAKHSLQMLRRLPRGLQLLRQEVLLRLLRRWRCLLSWCHKLLRQTLARNAKKRLQMLRRLRRRR